MSNKEEVKEVENIAKVFVIEQRVMDIAEELPKTKTITHTPIEPQKKQIIKTLVNKSNNQILNVRGLT